VFFGADDSHYKAFLKTADKFDDVIFAYSFSE